MLSCKDPINIMASKIAVANNKKVQHSKSVRVLNDSNSKISNYTRIKNPNYSNIPSVTNNTNYEQVQLANSAVPQRTNLPAVVTRSKSFIAREKTLSLMSATTGQNLISNSTNNQNLPNSFQRQKTFSTGQNSIPGQVSK